MHPQIFTDIMSSLFKCVYYQLLLRNLFGNGSVEIQNPTYLPTQLCVLSLFNSVPRELVPEVLSSTSIRVTWTPPPNAERLHFTYHVGYSSEFTTERSTPTTELSLILTGLHPFDVYTVTVEAENTGGRGGSTTKEARTLSDGMFCVWVVISPDNIKAYLVVCEHVHTTRQSWCRYHIICDSVSSKGSLCSMSDQCQCISSLPLSWHLRVANT